MISYFVDFATEEYKKAQKINETTMKNDGFDIITSFGKEDIKDFWKLNERILEPSLNGGIKNGGCLWKPLIIYWTLCNMKYGDICLYADCGDELKPGIKNFVEDKLLSRDYLFIENRHNHRDYTKQECFDLMNCNSEYFYKSNQLEAGFIAFRKTEKMTKFVEEWLYWCKKSKVILDETEFPVVRHSRDQSILTNLVLAHNFLPTSIYEVKDLIVYNKFG